jgi:hypothetical protein
MASDKGNYEHFDGDWYVGPRQGMFNLFVKLPDGPPTDVKGKANIFFVSTLEN